MKIEAFAVICLGVDVSREVWHMFQLFAPQAVEHQLGGEADQNQGLWLAPGRVLVVSQATMAQEQVQVATTLYWHDGQAVCTIPCYDTADVPAGTEVSRIRWLTRLQLYRTLKTLLRIDPSPWGILRGVRPTKIVHRLWETGKTPAEITAYLTSHYAVSPAKANLITTIAARQRPYLLSPAAARRVVSVYIGIPYCPSRCVYCSFPAFPLPPAQERQAFLQALAADMAAAGAFIRQQHLTVQTVYIGGGTPTSLPEEEFTYMLAMVRQELPLTAVCEFTVEAGRPDSLTPGKFTAMLRYGVTRLSINPQSMHDKTLRLIGRNHSAGDIIDMFKLARRMGFSVLNMDIIAGLPGEGLAEFRHTLRQVAALRPDNLTVHTLARKKGATMGDRGEWRLAGPQEVAAMLDEAAHCATSLGLVPYYLYRQKHMTGNLENVGYTRPGAACIYNIQIVEERQTIIGIGPNAGTKVVDSPSWRLRSVYNPKNVAIYVANLPVYLEKRAAILHAWVKNNKEAKPLPC